jgi:hypothetical protein
MNHPPTVVRERLTEGRRERQTFSTAWASAVATVQGRERDSGRDPSWRHYHHR